jgi:hypothetical protein
MKVAAKRRLRAELHAAQGGRCCWCGRRTVLPLSGQHRLELHTATLDHVLPRSRGGRDGRGNLVMACWECNRERNNLPADADPGRSAGLRAAVLLCLAEVEDLAADVGLRVAVGRKLQPDRLTAALAEVGATVERFRTLLGQLPAEDAPSVNAWVEAAC